MQNIEQWVPTDGCWAHRGSIPEVTLDQARNAAVLCVLAVGECVGLNLEPLEAVFTTNGGRAITVRPEIIHLPDGIGMRLHVEADPRDVGEAFRLHEAMVDAYPAQVRALLARTAKEEA